MFRKEKYKTLHWQEYNDAYLKLEERDSIEEVLPEIKEE
jgi:hypothetical protein